MRLIERLRERHRQAVERRDKRAAGWWVLIQIVWLLFEIWPYIAAWFKRVWPYVTAWIKRGRQ